MKLIKKSFTAILSVMLLFVSCLCVQAKDLAPFEDLAVDAWYTPYIWQATEKGWMSGKSSSLFDPDGSMIRADICLILYRLEGSPAVYKTSKFEDVSEEAYYYKAVEWAASKGIAQGFSETEFRPELAINREQLVTFLYRYYSKRNNMSVYGDIDGIPGALDISPFAKEAMIWAVINKAIGVNGTPLYPQRTATRAECAKILVATSEEGLPERINLVINGKSYPAILSNNVSAKALVSRMPFTKILKTYQDQEMYTYLTTPIESDPQSVNGIHAGDLMLFGEDCLMLFFQNSNNTYRYTPLASIMDTRGLVSLMSQGSVTVTFQKN